MPLDDSKGKQQVKYQYHCRFINITEKHLCLYLVFKILHPTVEKLPIVYVYTYIAPQKLGLRLEQLLLVSTHICNLSKQTSISIYLSKAPR